MKAGAIGKCPKVSEDELPDMLILNENRFAVLINENAYSSFLEGLSEDIKTVFLVTDYETNFRSMSKNLYGRRTIQLYRDYLDNFRINHGRN